MTPTKNQTTEAVGKESLETWTALALECARAAIDKRGESVKLLELANISSFTDYFLIVNGTSDRHVQSIADAVDQVMRRQGHRTLSSDGYTEGRWIVMDYGPIVVHVFLDALREYYDLETLWADAGRVAIPAEFYGPAATRHS
jgi:ribosome-associated protein